MNDATSLAESSYQRREQAMVLAAIARMGPRTAVLRAYGEFDDRYVGVEIFAHNKVLDPIWDSLPEE